MCHSSLQLNAWQAIIIRVEIRIESITRKFCKTQKIIEQIKKKGDLQEDIDQLKEELIRSEHFLRQKFVRFLVEFVPKTFWEITDELYKYNSAFPEITMDTFRQALLRIYDARSTYLQWDCLSPIMLISA